ncbi:PREDICTED: enolase-phosphatase E1-like [Polistes dominula]|uniref:Enolase-phosphatase E1-like n=1 Tax=Polistes dominula TaxID=743375 RepID=A0ABM1ICU4_POLDO|nr:PREDICTED: enolase-phosphatase E1-like [Polistes dominula]
MLMSDEDLVQCPYNPNHHVPRSQIDEHKNTCKFLMDPTQETQITFSSHDEPRPSTSYQESPQEGSSLQEKSSHQEESSQQEESQIAELPNLQGPSFQEWRKSQEPAEIQKTSLSKLKRPRLNPKSFRKRDIPDKSWKPKLMQDKKSSSKKSEMRIQSYYKRLNKERKELKKLKIDSGSDEASSSSSGSPLSFVDTMPDNKKQILYDMGSKFMTQLASTSQQKDCPQQESSSKEKITKKMDVERWVIQSSHFSSEVTTPLEVELEEPPSTRDVLQEQSQSFSVPAETTHDRVRSQQPKETIKKKHEEIGTEIIMVAEESHILSEVTTPSEVELEELPSTGDVLQQQSQPFSFPAATTHDSDDLQRHISSMKEKYAENIEEEMADAEVSHILATETNLQLIKTEEPSSSRAVPDIIATDHSDTTNDESPQADISQQESSSLQESSSPLEDSSQQEFSSLPEDSLLEGSIVLQEDSSLQEDSLLQGGSLLEEDIEQLEEIWGEETSDMLSYQDSIETGSSKPSSSVQEEQSKPVVSHDKAKHELNVPQKRSRVSKRSYESSSENTDIDDLQKEGCSPEADISSEADGSRRKKICLEKRRLYDSTSTTDEDKGEKIEFEKPSSSVPKKQSKPVVFRSKTKPLLDIPQEASKLRKRSHETSSENTDTDIGDLQKAGSSLKSDISPKADVSPRKRKCLEKRRRYDSTSTTDEDKGEQIEFEKPSSSVPKKQSEPVVSHDKAKHELTVPQKESRVSKRSYESSSVSTDIDDLQKEGSSPEADISSEEDGSRMETKYLRIKRCYHSSSSTDEDEGKKIDLKKPSPSSPKKRLKAVVTRRKTKHQLDVPQEASGVKKRSHETLSESIDIDSGDLQKAGSSPESDISLEADEIKMSDEELVQCPNNPNHLVPRSQIDEHVNTCELLMDPNQEMQITTPSDDEPRPSTSYQESLQEESSLQEGSLLQEGSSQQEESQITELPNLQGLSFQKWRKSQEPAQIQETSLSKLRRPRPNPKSFRKRDVPDKSWKPKLMQDKKSSSKKSEMRIQSYYKTLNKERKELRKLKIDSGSDEASSSGSGSPLSFMDTMPDTKKQILFDMGSKFMAQLASTSQKTDCSQQESTSQEKITEEMDVERWVIQSSRFSSEVTTPLEVESEEPPSTRDVLQEQSQSFSVPAETTHEKVRSQQPKETIKKKHEEIGTEIKIVAEESDILSEVTTPLEVELEEPPSTRDVVQEQSQSFSVPTETTHDRVRSQQLKETIKKKHEEIGTEIKMVAEESHILSVVITPLEVEFEEPPSTGDVLQEHSQSFSVPAETTHDSDLSQKSKVTEEKISEKMDTEEKIETEESHTLSEVTTQLEVEIEEPSFVADIDLEKPSTSSSTKQSKPVVSRGKTKHQSDVPQEASRLRKRLYETSSEDTDIDVDDIPLAVTPPKSDISPKAYVSPRKKKCLEKRRRSDSSSKTDED